MFAHAGKKRKNVSKLVKYKVPEYRIIFYMTTSAIEKTKIVDLFSCKLQNSTQWINSAHQLGFCLSVMMSKQ